MTPLARCSSNGCPSIDLDGDHVVVQGEVVELVRLDGGLWTEAQVRIPAAMLLEAAAKLQQDGLG